ncbi:MAG: flagellar biosynthetic protein FliR [Phycisphaerales bacterium]
MDPALASILEHLLPFWLVAARLSGLFLFAPVFASRLLTRRLRVMLLVMLTVALYPAVAAGGIQTPPLEVGTLAFVLLGEVMIGLAIGLLATMPLVAIQIAGSIISYKLGLALAQVFNPEFDAQSEVIGQILYLMGLAFFVQMGGLEHTVLAVMATFETLPAGGGWLDSAPAHLLAAMLDAAFVVGLRIAMPVLLMATLVSLAMGVLMRTIPQINIMTIGFAIQIVVGMLTLAISIYAIGDVAGEAIVEFFEQIHGWARTLGEPVAVGALSAGGVGHG